MLHHEASDVSDNGLFHFQHYESLLIVELCRYINGCAEELCHMGLRSWTTGDLSGNPTKSWNSNQKKARIRPLRVVIGTPVSHWDIVRFESRLGTMYNDLPQLFQ